LHFVLDPDFSDVAEWQIPALALSLALSPRARDPEFEALLHKEKGLE
jgi:hypothetical protein